MSPAARSYAVVTPARNEASNLARLAQSLEAQTLEPDRWVIVDDGSTDETAAAARELSRRLSWVDVVTLSGEAEPTRGGPIVRAFEAGVAALGAALPDVVVKLDADLTMPPDYFVGLVAAFAADPSLGIASGLCHEQRDGEWRPLYGTRSHVWGACRAYRRECLEVVAPLERRQGWDEIDAIKARLRGWSVRTIFDLPFRHHRPEGERDGAKQRWFDQGKAAHYMGYRFSYLLVRTLYRTLREPRAAAMLCGYAAAAARRAPRLPDADARAFLRAQQRARQLPLRLREALGRSA